MRSFLTLHTFKRNGDVTCDFCLSFFAFLNKKQRHICQTSFSLCRLVCGTFWSQFSPSRWTLKGAKYMLLRFLLSYCSSSCFF